MDGLFERKNNDECDDSDYTKCAAMKRLMIALKYYSKFKITSSQSDQEIFNSFMNNTYTDTAFTNDHIHFTQHHEHQLEQINKDLNNDTAIKACAIGECTYTMRHQRDPTANSDITDVKLKFYIQIMDSFHFHLFHCFDVGLRSKTIDTHSDVAANNDPYFDKAFARINSDITQRQQHIASFERLSSNYNTKYSISTDREHKEDKPYIDELFKHLIMTQMCAADIKSFVGFITLQEYDSDSMKYDQQLQPHGNLSKYSTIYDIEDAASTSSFSIGFRYYYWIKYKCIENTNDELWDYNRNDHSGYTIKQLYIEYKYTSFQEEITHYKYIEFREYKEVVLIKIKQYEKTNRVKSTTATYAADRFHYDIETGEPIRFEHLLALALYTDYTQLCTHFSATFRKQHTFETLKSMMERNREYYWWSKRLRECVELYGQSRWGDRRYNKDEDICLKGPFFLGMSVIMNVPSFNVRLCCPTSTSRKITVAMRFCGDEGMILELDNPHTAQYKYLHGFSAYWISRFPEEGEILFIGGAEWIKIETVRIRKTKQNFKQFIYPLYYLDVMLTGGEITKDLKIKQQHVFIIKRMMDTILNNRQHTFDDYVVSTFDTFAANKKQIVLRLFRLNDADDKMRELFMNNMEKRQQNTEKQRQDTDWNNLFRTEMLEVFNNTETVVIQSTNPTGRCSWSLSMFALLSLIEKGSIDTVIIKAVTDMFSGCNWIKDIWSLSSAGLMKQYGDKNYSISMKEVNYGYPSYWFVIHRKK